MRRICYCNYPSPVLCEHELHVTLDNCWHDAQHPLVKLILDHEDGRLGEEAA